MGLAELGVSAVFIILTCGLAQAARKVIDRISSIHGLVKELILEAIAAAELCGCCFELIIGNVLSDICVGYLQNGLKPFLCFVKINYATKVMD
jgi:hypothetical protein